MLGGKFAFTNAFWANDGIDGNLTEVSQKLCLADSCDHTQQGIHEGFLRKFVVFVANGIKILAQGDLGNDAPQIGEGETVAASHFMLAFGDIFQPCRIDPRDGSCHHSEVDVIDHGMGITGLAFATADILFDFLETGFDLPPRTILLNDLFNGEFQVSGKESNPLCSTKDPDHPDRAFERLDPFSTVFRPPKNTTC
jgi:hypothetical protein